MLIRKLIAALSGALLPILSVLAQGPATPDVAPDPLNQSAQPDAAVQAGSAQLTSADVSAWLDGMLPSAMAIGDVAGAVVVVVRDDHILVQKGYGFADVEKRTPVSPDKTMFRPGSISKLFTWTAVMQLVEQGKLDLDGDINNYIDFKVDGFNGKPIKLRHLMTHTPGLEEKLQDLLITDQSKMTSLGDALKSGVPAPIFEPGTVPAYSNYGAALAGYIVERASGLPFEEYIEEFIFKPLHMDSSTFRQPVPAELAGQLAKSYLQASAPKDVSFEYCPDAPAGALSATGTDMAQFMLAHLDDGIVPNLGESSRILMPETLQRMHSVANRPAPTVDAMALGFYEQNRNGTRAIAHGGDLTAFHSDLLLVPEAKVGLFLSFNSIGRDTAAYSLRTALTDGFVDRYFPRREPLPAPADVSDAKAHAQAVAGSYELSRRAEKNLFSFFYMLGQTKASVTDKGYLQIAALTKPNTKPRDYEEIAPWLWREVTGETRLAVVRTEDGRISQLVPDGYGPIFVFQPTPGWRDASWLLPALGFAAAVIAIVVLTWFVRLVRRLIKRAPRVPALAGRPGQLQLASRIGVIGCFVFLLFLGLLVMSLSGSSFWILSSDARWLLRLIQLSALIAVLGAVATLATAYLSWRSPDDRWKRSLGKSLVAVACLVCAYLAIAFHFLSPVLNY